MISHYGRSLFKLKIGASVKSRFNSSKPLYDKFGRGHDYLRISLTERCNLRCTYCMPENGIQLTDRERCLNLEELERLTTIFVKFCGITKLRLTGGEPTIDSKLVPILKHLNKLREYGLSTLAITTNGLTLAKQSNQLKSLGLNCVNISLDTLKEHKFEQITRRKGFKRVQEGIISAIEANFDRVKLNCVVVRGFNDDEILDFVKLAQTLPIEVRFIEFMPFAGNKWALDRMISYKQILDIICSRFPDLQRLQQTNPSDVSKSYRSQSWLGSVGFISSMSEHFCSGCNRLRITSDGQLKVCLFGREETSLRDLLRNGARDEEIVSAISASLAQKKLKHAGASSILQLDASRPMIKIGFAQRMFHTTTTRRTNDDAQAGDRFSHLDYKGKAKMVNVGAKVKCKRIARAEGRIQVGDEILKRLEKGDVLTVAKIAGIMGAKSTHYLIPLCHQIPLDCVHVDIIADERSGSLVVTGSVEAYHNTGVEMESLMSVSITLLTLYDMCKSVNKSMIISNIKLLSKVKIPQDQ